MAFRYSSDGLTLCCVAEKLQPHSQEKFWRGLRPSAVCSGAFYYPKAMSLVVDKLIAGQGNGCYALQYELSSSAELSASHRFIRRPSKDNSGVVKPRY